MHSMNAPNGVYLSDNSFHLGFKITYVYSNSNNMIGQARQKPSGARPHLHSKKFSNKEDVIKVS